MYECLVREGDVLSVTIYAIDLPVDLDYDNLQYITTFLTNEELERYITDPDADVFLNIIAGEKGVVAVE